MPETPEASAVRFAPLPSPFRLRKGGWLQQAQVAYECWGELNADRSNAILLFTGLSPSAHARSSAENPEPGWWEKMIGPGLALDTDRWFVMCVNSLGSCFGSTGPASINPATGRPYRLSFPELSVEDIARAGYEAARSLGIEKLDTVMGPSLGGMVAVAFAAVAPGGARRLVSISGSPGALPFAISLRSLQREAIVSDPAWQSGNYLDPLHGPQSGMRIARKLGTITYRSAEEWRLRFGRNSLTPTGRRAVAQAMKRSPEGFGPRFDVESYLEAQAERFVRVFDPNCYLYLSRALDGFDLRDHGEPVEVMKRAGLESALVIGVESDLLFTIREQAEIAAMLEQAGVPTRFARLPCIEGHDAFLVDLPRFDAAIRSFLNS
ncbi:MAG: homoserine O-acetyltransferase [Nevskiaceae bacterium]|jgi:homoserine O-acetyltransferase|nr:homoserine O-acetyltransferase [Nevskiaceae bacterium]